MTTTELYQLFQRYPVVTTDTRNCPPHSLFFALKGETFDGNQFAKAALEKGCAYAIVDSEQVAATDSRLIYVPDALQALQNLAAYHRHQLGTPILQITGTNGKTTTKELCAAVLSETRNVWFTQGNLNNHIGVPKTLLQLTSAHDVAVVETGANHPGEIAQLSRIVDADFGLITNVGRAHLEGFGSFEGVVRTKGELFDFLRTKPNSVVFLHADNLHLQAISHGLKTITYGSTGQGCSIEGEALPQTDSPYLHLRWRVAGGEWNIVHTQLIGQYNLSNVLAAAAVGTHFGVSPAQIVHALQNYHPSNSRSELLRTDHNTLIVDAYNANPTSMAASLENFIQLPYPHKLAILGSMRELGESCAQEHEAIVRILHESELPEVWLVGEEFQPFSQGFQYFHDVEEVKTFLTERPLHGRLILIKGSNSTRLHQLPALL